MTYDFSGRTLSRKFVLHRRIGYGGMATVYEATNLQVDKRVAVKVLNPEFITHETVLVRFRQEARSAARLSHPNIVQIHDYDVDGELPYIVMEYLDGCSLSELLRKGSGWLPWRRVALLCAQVCSALQYAHERQILHRDIKPSNVYFLEESEHAPDHVKLLDFGIAKVHPVDQGEQHPLTRPSQVPGTPEYMAPEQAQGHPCDARADLYSLGVMMYRMLTGRLPFHGATATETLAQHVFRAPTPLRQVAPDLDIPLELEAIVLKALEKSPEHRWSSAHALREALFAVLDDPHRTLVRVEAQAEPVRSSAERPAAEGVAAPALNMLQTLEWREVFLRQRRVAAAFTGISVGLGAFMFFSLFPLPGVQLIAGGPASPPPSERPRPRARPTPPPPLVAGPPVAAQATVAPPPPEREAVIMTDTSPTEDPPIPPAIKAPAARPPAPPPDPKRRIEGFLRKSRAKFRECSEMIPFSEPTTLRVDLTLEPSTGRAFDALVVGDLKNKPFSVCAVRVLRGLKYPRYAGEGQLKNLELKL
jgi:serine/threonine protein kinase